jgi:hypothetical protein
MAQHKPLQRRLMRHLLMVRRIDVVEAELAPLDCRQGVEAARAEERAVRTCRIEVRGPRGV